MGHIEQMTREFRAVIEVLTRLGRFDQVRIIADAARVYEAARIAEIVWAAGMSTFGRRMG